MRDLELRDAALRAACDRLERAALSIRVQGALPMLDAPSFTGIGGVISEFMRTADRTIDALRHAGFECAEAAASVIDASGETDSALAAVMLRRDSRS